MKRIICLLLLTWLAPGYGADFPESKLVVQRVHLKKSVSKVIGGKARKVTDVVELRIESASPIPARALDPVLFVGDHPVTSYRYIEKNVILFTEYAPESLSDGKEVRLQWGLRAPPGSAPLKLGIYSAH